MSDEPEEEDVLPAVFQPQSLLRLQSRKLLSEMRVEGMVPHHEARIRPEAQKVRGNGVAHCHEAVTALEEILCERGIEETRFVGNHIVKDGDYPAAFSGVPRHIAQRRGEPGHPVSHYKDVRLPLPDFPGGGYPCQRVRRIQHGFAFHRDRLVLRRHVLRFPGEEDVRILPAEIEGLHNRRFAQFQIQIGIELGNSSPEGVKAR